MLQKILNKILKKFGKIYLKKKAVEETRSPQLMAQISKGSLLRYYGNVHSQIGQDSILQEIFKKLVCRAFFASLVHDGVYLSNCRKLVEEGWSGVFVKVIKRSLGIYCLSIKVREAYIVFQL